MLLNLYEFDRRTGGIMGDKVCRPTARSEHAFGRLRRGTNCVKKLK